MKKDDMCCNLIFLIAEGQYLISDSSKKSHIYGESSFINMNDTYNC